MLEELLENVEDGGGEGIEADLVADSVVAAWARGGKGGNLVVWEDGDIVGREGGLGRGAREERQEKREEDGEEFFHGSRVSGQRLKS